MNQPVLQGMGVSEGIVKGVVRIVFGIEDSNKFTKGDILVTKITDPAMVAMMAKAGAIVCDIGGITSHPSIVSRELGIPCIVNTKDGTQKLKEGMKVKVDGEKGNVYLLDSI